MMKVLVVCANGKVGRLVVKEALARGMDVTAAVRGDNQSAADKVIQKDLFALTKEDVAGFDTVVDAFGVWTPETLSLHTTSLMHLADILIGTEPRLLVVGGAGSLYLDESHTSQVKDTAKGTPYYPLMEAMGEALTALRTRQDVDWTYISPAANFVEDGPRTGTYTLCGEEFSTNDAGESWISYADFAVAMVDEIEKGNHHHQRISVRK